MWPPQLESDCEFCMWLTPTYSTGKQASPWNVVLLVPQGLCTAPACGEHTAFAASSGCKSEAWSNPEPSRRPWCWCACQPGCGDWRKFFFYLKHDSSQKQKNPGWALSSLRGAEGLNSLIACHWLVIDCLPFLRACLPAVDVIAKGLQAILGLVPLQNNRCLGVSECQNLRWWRRRS